MSPDTGRGILVAMGPVGWFLACIFGVLACLLAGDARGHDAPWQILGALVLGSMLSSIPVGLTLLAACRAFARSPSSPTLPVARPTEPSAGSVSWRWTAFVVLCGLEVLVLPLTVVAAAAEDDTLLLSIPLNIALVTAAIVVACWRQRRRAALVLCTIHLVGIMLAAFAAAIEIESVMLSGVLLLITAVALACVGTRPRPARLFFALSTIVFILTSFFVIAVGEIGQHEAEAPLFAAIITYQILFAPVGMLVLYRELTARSLPFRLQFGLRQMLAVMVLVCVAAALARLAFAVDHDLKVAVAVGVNAVVAAGIALAVAAGCWDKGSAGALRPHKPSAV